MKHFKKLYALLLSESISADSVVDSYAEGVRAVFGSDLTALTVLHDGKCLHSFGESPLLCRTIADDAPKGEDGAFQYLRTAGEHVLVAKAGRRTAFTVVVIGNFALGIRFKPNTGEMEEALSLASLLFRSTGKSAGISAREILEKEMKAVCEGGSILVFAPATQKTISELFYYKERVGGLLNRFVRDKRLEVGIHYLDSGYFVAVSNLEAGTLRGYFTEFYRDQVAFFNDKLATLAAVFPLGLYYSSYPNPFEAVLQDFNVLLSQCDGFSIINTYEGGEQHED